jgi:glycosyltransferase involved in cell wall biosynthesis
MKVTNKASADSKEGNHTILHIIERLTTGGASRVILGLSKHSSRKDPRFQHKIISLLRPTPDGIKLAEGYGYEVDHGCGKPFLDYQIQQSDIVHVHWWNCPAMHQFMDMDLAPSRLLLWCHVAGKHIPQVITSDLIDYADVTVATNPTTFAEVPAFTQLSPEDRACKTAMIVDPTDFDRVSDVTPREHDGFNVGYIGTVHHYKMHPHFIRMSSGIKVPDIQFLVCGSGIERELKMQAKLLKSERKFSFLGHVENIQPILEQLDVYGYPLCEDTYASGELNLQEVMQAGIPSVVFPYGGIKGLIVDQFSGLVVDTEKAYQEAIQHLFHHPEERSRIGQNAKQIAQQLYGAENAVRQLNPLYLKLLEKPKRQHQLPLSATAHRFLQNHKGSAAARYVHSLGEQGRAYRVSLSTTDFHQGLEADQAISQMSPLAHIGGILEHLNLHAKDAWLRFWSGLAFLGQGNGPLALSEFAKAKTDGCANKRLIWHIARAALLCQQWDLAEQCLSELKMEQPNFTDAEAMWQKLPSRNQSKTRLDSPEALNLQELMICLKNHVEKEDLDAARSIFKRLSPEEALDSDASLDWIQIGRALGLNDWVLTAALESGIPTDTTLEINQNGLEIAFDLNNKDAFFKLIDHRRQYLTDDPLANRMTAQWHVRDGNHLHAAQFLARSLQSEPNHIPTLHLLAECFREAGETESEQLTLQEISRIQSSQPIPELASPSESASSREPGKALEPETTSKSSTLDEPLVTALVSAYASERFMEGCLENLTAQTLANRLEILVIDSASPENEGDIVRRFQKKHANIRYIRTDERESLYEAWNRGVKEARGRYIVNANTDDAHRNDAFERLLDLMEKHPETGLAYADCLWTSKPNDQFPSEHVLREVHYPDYHPGLSLFYCYTACLQFWRKSTLLGLGLFDTQWKAVGDYEILMRAAQSGVQVRHLPETLSLFFQNTEGITQQSDLSANEEQQIRDDFRKNLDVCSLYGVDSDNDQIKALAWADLAEVAFEMRVPWHDSDQGDNAFAIHCLQRSLEIMPQNELAAGNLLWLLSQYGHLDAGKQFLHQLSEYWTPQHIGALSSLSTHWNAAADPQPENQKSTPIVPEPIDKADTASTTEQLKDVHATFPETVHWHAPFFNPSGYGSEALQFVVPLADKLPVRIHHNSSIVSETFVAGLETNVKRALQKMIPQEGEHSGMISVCHGPAPCFQRHPGFKHHIGRTMFETDRLPESWLPFMDMMDEIWVPSTFNRDAFVQSGVNPSKLSILPGAVDEAWFDPSKHTPMEMASETGFRFLSVFEWIQRKGWDVLIKAYLQEFTVKDDVVLTLRASLCNHPKEGSAKVIQGNIVRLARELGLSPELLPRIEILPDALPWQQLPSMYLASQCLVAPSRGEGWGRPQHEAMMMGLPVIATNWSGTTEFINESNAYLLDYTLKEITDIDPGFEFYKGHRWADPSTSHLRLLMRHVFENRTEAIQKGEAAREHVSTRFSRHSVAKLLSEKLETLLHHQGSSTHVSTAIRSSQTPEPPASSGPINGKFLVRWEGPFLGAGSLAHVNRALTQPLIDSNVIQLTTHSTCELTEGNPSVEHHAAPDQHTDIVVRHQWPPHFTRPAHGKLVIMQPWEYGSLPREWVEHSNLVDEFWAYTEHVRAVYVKSGIPEDKVKTLPLGFDPSRFHPDVKPLLLPTDKKFKFLFVGGTLPRKGADALLKAYCSAFGPKDDVCLVVKDFGAGHVYAGQTMEQQILALQKHPDAPEIIYINEELDEVSMPALYKASDCLVHPYRGEGFGLPVLEAMGCGLPVIVTRGGACDDFTPETCVYPVKAERRIIGRSIGEIPVQDEAWWLEPSVEDLMRQMKHCVSDQTGRQEKGRQSAEYAHANWTWAKASEAITKRLTELSQINVHGSAPVMADQAKTEPAAITLPSCAFLGDIRAAHAAYRNEKWLDAWTQTLTAIQERPFHPEGYLLLGKIAASVRDYPKAKQCVGILKKITPNWADARQFKKRLSKATRSAKPKCQLSEVPEFPRQSRISVCLIAKNEERNIEQCLQSVKSFAYETIVLDTGSTDCTKEIAAASGAKVVEATWNDHFSEARNACLEHATGDWLLILDADERIDQADLQTLTSEVKSHGVLAYRLPLVNHGTSEMGNSYVPRLVRNAPGLFFVGRVHEQIFSSMEVLRRRWSLDCRLGQTPIQHYGYTQQSIDDKQKNQRNLKLLALAVEEMPDDSNLLMNFGLELRRQGDHERALKQYEKAFEAMLAMPDEDIVPEFRETLVQQFGQVLLHQQEYAPMLTMASHPKVAGHVQTASLHFLKGMAQAQIGLLSDAVESLEQCLKYKDDPALSPIISDIQTGLPHLFLAKIHDHNNELQKANEAFERAVDLSPENVGILVDYASFLDRANHTLDALKLLHRQIRFGARDKRFWKIGTRIAFGKRGLEEFASDWTKEAIKYFGQDTDILYERLESLIFNREWTQASNFKSEFLPEPTTPEQEALSIMTDLVSGMEFKPFSEEDERSRSAAFIKHFRQLIEQQDAGAVHQITENLHQIQASMPTAFQMIEQAIRSADEACMVK